MSLNILEIVSHKWNKECDTAVFKHHRISAFVTAIVSTKEVKLVAVLPDLWLLLQGISVDGLAITAHFFP